MTTRLLLGWCIVIALILVCAVRNAEAVPPRPEQANPDQFPPAVVANNAVTQKAKATHAVTYSITVADGCSLGTIATDFQDTVRDNFNHYGLTISRDDAAPDFYIDVNCGNGQIANCGSVNIFCVLGRPYYGPYDRPHASISDVLNVYPAVTRRSILMHEVSPGHIVGTWNEQYQLDGNFSSTPGALDIMNTGPLSRHDLGPVEDERFDRTMWPIFVTCSTLGYDPCTQRFIQPDGLSWKPADAYWYDRNGNKLWGPCNADKLRPNEQDHKWQIPGVNIGYDWLQGLYLVVPPC